MKRYNLLDGESYGKKYQMVEEKNGDWVWYEDLEEMVETAKDVIARWDSPLWKDQPHTGVFIDKLRAAIAKAQGDQL